MAGLDRTGGLCHESQLVFGAQEGSPVGWWGCAGQYGAPDGGEGLGEAPMNPPPGLEPPAWVPPTPGLRARPEWESYIRHDTRSAFHDRSPP